MLAYRISQDGFGYMAHLPRSNAFFWSKNTAGKFCEAQTRDYINNELRRYVEKADFQEGFYKTIRKHKALENLKRFVMAPPTQPLPELVNQVIELEPELYAIVPSIKHPNYYLSRLQVDNLIWFCIRIRKQFKNQFSYDTKTQKCPSS